jgi:hypothetical protein
MTPERLRSIALRLRQASSMMGGIGVLDTTAKEIEQCANDWERDRETIDDLKDQIDRLSD